MANLVIDQSTGKLLLQKNVAASGTTRTLLETENTFVDNDIIVEVVTPAGALTSGATTIAINDEDNLISVETAEPASGEYITVTAQGAVSAGTGGFIAQNTAANSTEATKYITIQNATFTVDGAAVKTTQAGLVGDNTTVGTIGTGAQTITCGDLTAGSGSTAITSNGLSNGVDIDATSKVTLAETNGNGYYKITASGSGTVNRAAVTKQVTTAGYFTADSNPVNAISADSLSSNTAEKAYYIQQSTLSSANVTPATTDQTVTISAGYYHTSRTVTIAAMTSVTPTTSLANTGLSTYFNEGTFATHDVSLTPQYSTAAGFVGAQTDTNNGGIGYYNIKTQTVTEGTTTVSGTNATRGTRTESAGWKNSSETLEVATFATSATNGQTYVDISNTTAAPVLVSGGDLYINSGWTDNLKISVAKLVPDGTDIKGHADYMLSGHTALDEDGTVVTGNIPTYTGSYTNL
jgi:hypothetical protein